VKMRTHTVLAGVAALALFVGAGIASAQDNQDQNKGPQGNPPAAQQMNKGPSAGKTTQSQEIQAGKNAARMETAGKKTRMSRGRTHMNGKTAARERNRRMAAERRATSRQTTAQQQPNRGPNAGQQQFGQQQPRNGLEGLQGNAAGGNVQLSEEQRTQIRSTVLNGPNVPRASNVGFPVVAGTVVPRDVRIMPVPPTLVRIDPAWRHYRYFVWNDQLVIVNPRDMRIVSVVYI
jgi:hypothetical protein